MGAYSHLLKCYVSRERRSSVHPSPPSAWRTPAEAEAVLAPLLGIPAVRLLREAAAGRAVHLVGGTLRDRLLGRPHRDIDAVVEREGAAVAARLAAMLGARVVPLGHEALVSYRVAHRDLVVDLWDRGGAPLALDLARRDVTINALALDLVTGRLVDPLGGLADLVGRRLRVPAPQVLDEDPLRVLRLVRLAAELAGFRPTPETLEAARDRSGRLDEIPGERIRHELEIILGALPGLPSFELLCELDVHPRLLLGDASAHVRTGGRRILERSDALLDGRGLPIAAVDALLLHWTLLLAPLPTGPAAAAMDRLRRRGYLGRRIARQWTVVSRHEEPPDDLRAQRWFLHRLGPLWPTAATVAASLSTERSLESCRDLLLRLAELAATEGDRLFDPPPLLATAEVMALAGLRPGPDLGRILERLRRKQIEGELVSGDDARRWLAGSTPR